MVAAVKIPVTLKIRAGWDEESINGPEVTQIGEAAGAKVIFVHGRTRKQGYRGPANWEYIKECKKAARNILVFGNGDVVDPLSAEKMFKETECDGVLLSRGLFGRPYVIEDIIRHFTGQAPLERRGEDMRNVFLEHLDLISSYQSPKKAVLDMRRVGSWYLKKGIGAKKLKELVVRAEEFSKVRSEIEKFDWDSIC